MFLFLLPLFFGTISSPVHTPTPLVFAVALLCVAHVSVFRPLASVFTLRFYVYVWIRSITEK
ncbi:hypothetical protein CPC08DRAFT_714409 [Agrocybe pediades]|nr:hypothetical protein CPC08DRAFT_714409 [Agrocybe pediades]